MARKKVVILGSTGMLGSMLLDVFTRSGEVEIIATYRSAESLKVLRTRYGQVDFRLFDAEKATLGSTLAAIKDADWVVNAIGITKPYIHEDSDLEVERAINVNASFPHQLAAASQHLGAKVLQIATDCVYSGAKGRNVEAATHDALDVYGKTKSLGEVYRDAFYNLRCSIIGPELNGHLSLMAWFLGHPRGSLVNGYTNHVWNGITTLHFARICEGIIKSDTQLPHLQHIVPADVLTKANLLKCIATEFRSESFVTAIEAHAAVDRTLSTVNLQLNQRLWQMAGYKSPPSISSMIKELAQYTQRKGLAL